MIKQGIVNFFKSLKYFFTPLGTIALGLIIGLSIAVPGAISLVSALAGDVKAVLAGTSVDFTALGESLEEAVMSLDWSDPLAALSEMLSREWLTATINACVGAFVEVTDVYAAGFSAAVTAFLRGIVGYIVLVAIFLVLGFVGGYFLVRWLIRRNIARRDLLRSVLAFVIDAFIAATLIAVCLWLLSVWKPSAAVTTVVSLLLFGFISLLEAYVVNACGKVRLREIVSFKNILSFIAANIIVLLLGAACVVAVTFLTNEIAGGILGIVFMEIAFIVAGANAESYVINKANEADMNKNAAPET